MTRTLRSFALAGLAALPVLVPVGARAAAGVLEINQTCALETGCFPGDDPGFPVAIATPGSYRLTSDLDVRGQVSPENVIAIQIDTARVSLDLAGFAIRGPVSCSGTGPAALSCTGVTASPAGRGITAVGIPDVRVRNGRITGMGQRGIHLGDRARIEDVHVDSTGSSFPVICGEDCLVLRSLVHHNPSNAVTVGHGSRVLDCQIEDNGGFGIEGVGKEAVLVHGTVLLRNADELSLGAGSSVLGSVIRDPSGGVGLSLGAYSGYAQDVLSGGVILSGGVNMGGNACNGAPCP